MQVMWRAVEDELKSIKVENLGYDHPLCSGILDDCSTPITEIPERSREAFKASSKKYHIRHCEILKNICEEYVLKENKKISTKMFEDLDDASFGEFLDRPERLKEANVLIYECFYFILKHDLSQRTLTNQMLEVLYVSYSSLVDLYKLTLTLSNCIILEDKLGSLQNGDRSWKQKIHL